MKACWWRFVWKNCHFQRCKHICKHIFKKQFGKQLNFLLTVVYILQKDCASI